MQSRKIRCPICDVDVRHSTIVHNSYCITCDDELRALRKSAALAAIEEENAQIKTFDEAASKWRRVSKKLVKDKKAKEHSKELAQQERELLAMHREQASIALARRSLLHYVERYKPGYDSAWLHEDISRRIEKFVRDVADNKSPRLILQVSSRSGKSLLASEAAPAWILGQHPNWQVVISSASEELPIGFSRQIRSQLRSPEYRQIFPHGARLNPEDSGAKAWTTNENGGVRAVGVGGQILGFGAHVFIVDDPIRDMEQADNPTAMEKVYDWFSSIAYSRLMPGGGILVIQQRMSHDDLVGRLLENMNRETARLDELASDVEELRARGNFEEANVIQAEREELDKSMDRWDVVTYPALATHDEYLDNITGDIIRVSPGTTVDPADHPDVRMLRRFGEAIHPTRYTRHYYLKLKRANERRFAAMYQLTPQVDDGEYFNVSGFKRYPRGKHPKPERLHIYTAWDLAIGTKQTNDHTVGIAGGIDSKGQLWLMDRVRGRWGDIRRIADMIIDMHIRWGASQTGIERTHVEMAMGPIIKTRMRERDLHINLAEGKEALKPISDKKVRARTLQNLCQSGKVMVPEGEDWDEYISLMTRFGATTVDDDVDASAWLAILATRNAPPRDAADLRAARAKKERSWFDDFIEEHTASAEGYMSS